MLVLAVNGHEVLGTGETLHELQLLLAGVTRYVYLHRGVVDDGNTHLGQLVDDAAHQLLVAGDGGGGQHHQVAVAQGDLRMLAEGHTVEGGHGLALGACGDEGQLLGLVALDVADIDQHALGHLHVAQLHGGGDDVDHASTRDGHLAAVARRDVDDLLNAMHVRGEGGDHDAATLVHGEDHFQGLAHLGLRGGVAGTLGVGGLAHEEQDTLAAQLTQTGDVHHITVNGGEIQLEVTRVDDHAQGGVDSQGTGVGDGVVHADELHGEGGAQADGVTVAHATEVGLLGQSMLLELVLNDTQSQAGGVDGHIQLLQDVGNGADVVLVAVGDDHTADAVAVLLQVGHVGDHQVDTGHLILVGEANAAVHDDDVLTVLNDGHVLAYLVETAQGDHTELGTGNGLQGRDGGLAARLGGLSGYGVRRHHDGILGGDDGGPALAAAAGLGQGRGRLVGSLLGGLGGVLGTLFVLSALRALLVLLGLGCLLALGGLGIALGAGGLGLLLLLFGLGEEILGLLLALAVVGGGDGLLLGGSQLVPLAATGLGCLLLVVKGREDLGGGEDIPGADAELAATVALELGGLGFLVGAGLAAGLFLVLIVLTHGCSVPLFLSVRFSMDGSPVSFYDSVRRPSGE